MKIVLYPFDSFVLPFLIGVVLLFSICLYKYIRWIRQFNPEQRKVIQKNWYSWKIIPSLWEMVREGLLHVRIFKKNIMLGIMHQAFALGWFLLIVVGAMESTAALKALNDEHSLARVEEVSLRREWHRMDKSRPYMPDQRVTIDTETVKGRVEYKRPMYVSIFYRYFIHSVPENFSHHRVYTNLMDALLLYVFLGLSLAILKKLRSKSLGVRNNTRHTLFDGFSKFALWSIFPLRFLAESATASLYGNGGFLTQSMGNLFDPVIAGGMEHSLWLFYSLMLGIFFSTMPFTRYMHIFTELLLIFFRKTGVKENCQKSGYTFFELNACSRCGICIEGCPMDKELGNHKIQAVYLVRALRNHERGRRLRRVADNCLMCGHCVVDCPVGIDLESLRVMARSHSQIDTRGNYSYMEYKSKPFNAIGRVAYFGGCMSHLTPAITQAMETIFEAAGERYFYMDKYRTICCGRPLRQQGFLNQSEELRLKNTELIHASGATVLVTSCPICYQSFKKEYNLNIPVVHHTEYIDRLVKTGRIKVGKDDRTVAYHDPCELGRGCGVYEEPRSVLRQVTTLAKVEQEREESICCGFNLGNTRLSLADQTKVRNSALANLTDSGAGVIATACPMCKKAFMHATAEYPVQDIAEIVAANLILDNNHGK